MTCPSCGTSTPEGARFCPSCGHLLLGVVDERRIVTVLFADLVGFTGFSETRDPEQVKNLVERCFERLAADVTAYGGRVDKIVGDEIIALFGAPIAHEDDAERAVRAALQMQVTVAAYAEECGVGLQLRVGVNTGEVLVGAVRAGEYTAMGDVVNVGARLRGLADPGWVVVGPETYAATRDVVRYEPLGALRARGREELVDSWRAFETMAPPGHRPRRGPTPLVGRDEELGMLTFAVATAVARRRAQLIVLLGEAGVGKSRLAEEVAEQARAAHDAVVLEGRCVPYGEANPWWPIGEALRTACGIEASDDAEVSVAKCRNAVAAATALAPEAAETSRLADGLLYLMGDEDRFPDVDPTRARDEARRALRAFLEGLARDRPVLLVLSELHWADPLVLEQVARLDRVRDLPLVIVATARPELTDRWGPPTGRHNVLVANLEPLDETDAGRLLDALLPAGTPPDLRALLLERSGGNPFFLEELVSLLGQQGSLDAGPLFAGEVQRDLPATLRGLLAARLDTLTTAERGLLADAAVVGRVGSSEALLAMSESRSAPDGKATLESLGSKDLLALRTGEWEFRSNLVRDVAYETMTKAERARRHARLGDWLSERLKELDREDEELEQLAHHYGAAAEIVSELGAVDGVAPDVGDVALDWIARATHRADQRDMHLASLHLVDQALRIANDEARRRPLLLKRAAARAAVRELQSARDDVAYVRAAAEADGDRAELARALTVLGEIEQKEGRSDASLVTLGSALELWQEVGDTKGEADALRLRGMTSVLAGRPDAAEPDIQRALAAFREVGHRRGEAWALQSLAWASFAAGHGAKAEERLEKAGKVFTEIGDWGGLGWVTGLLGWVRFQQGDLDGAEVLARQVLGEIRDRGDRWGTGITLLLLASVRLWKGEPAEAIPLAQESRELFRQLDDAGDEIRALGPLARALVAQGRVDEANVLLEEAHARVDRSGHGDAGGFAALVTGAAALHAGDADHALQAAQMSIDVLSDNSAVVPERLALMGMALLMNGDVDGALERLEEAVELSDEGPRANALAGLALARAAAGDHAGALDAAGRVDATGRSTYLDRATAGLARGLALVQAGDLVAAEDAFTTTIAAVDATGDRVMQAVGRLAFGIGFGAVESPVAEKPATEAREQLTALGLGAGGWERAFRAAASARGARAT